MRLCTPYVVTNPRDSSLSLRFAPSLTRKCIIFICTSVSRDEAMLMELLLQKLRLVHSLKCSLVYLAHSTMPSAANI